MRRSFDSPPPAPFEIGETVRTPTGAIAFVVDVNLERQEATVHWLSRAGERADFRFSMLRKVKK